jgi:hypothetical protein
MNEKIQIAENLASKTSVNLGDEPNLRGHFKLEKFYHDETGRPLECPFEVIEFENAITNVGGALLLDLIVAAGGTAYNNANAYIGVGDSTTAFAVGQTDLQAATNKLRKAMDVTFPSRSGQVMSWKSTFASGDANFAWEEAGIFNASTGGTMLCRKVQAMGTKVSGTTWTLTYTITAP